MKRLLAIGALVLAGCGGTTEKIVYMPATDAPATTPKTTDAPIAVAPSISAEDQFIRDIEDSYGRVYNKQDTIETGRLTCTVLRGGATAYDIVNAITGTGGDDFIAVVVASAITNFCPDQAWKFNN